MRLSLCLIKLSTNSINKTFCWPQQEMQEKWHKQGKQTGRERWQKDEASGKDFQLGADLL